MLNSVKRRKSFESRTVGENRAYCNCGSSMLIFIFIFSAVVTASSTVLGSQAVVITQNFFVCRRSSSNWRMCRFHGVGIFHLSTRAGGKGQHLFCSVKMGLPTQT